MKREQAYVELLKGEAIRRENWLKDAYWKIHNGRIWRFNSGVRGTIVPEDLLDKINPKNWCIYEEFEDVDTLDVLLLLASGETLIRKNPNNLKGVFEMKFIDDILMCRMSDRSNKWQKSNAPVNQLLSNKWQKRKHKEFTSSFDTQNMLKKLILNSTYGKMDEPVKPLSLPGISTLLSDYETTIKKPIKNSKSTGFEFTSQELSDAMNETGDASRFNLFTTPRAGNSFVIFSNPAYDPSSTCQCSFCKRQGGKS